MAFQISPGVLTQEIDRTNVIPSVSTSTGAIVVAAQWGPVLENTLITSEKIYVETFGKPNDTVFKDYFTANAFLAYSNGLKVIRNVGVLAVNGNVGGDGSAVTAVLVKNRDH